jgi:predicted amidohydrolase YtcJ
MLKFRTAHRRLGARAEDHLAVGPHGRTSSAAFASFEESSKGILAPGFLADFVIIERDLEALSPEDIRDASVETTVAGGRVVYQEP